MKLIPLDTKHKYYCSEDGRIFRNGKEIKGFKHRMYIKGQGYTGKEYLRFYLIMSNGKPKHFYAQRLTAFTYLDLAKSPGKLVRHKTDDTMKNGKDDLRLGTQLENQTIDRVKSGNYMNRGGKQKDELETNNEDLPF